MDVRNDYCGFTSLYLCSTMVVRAFSPWSKEVAGSGFYTPEGAKSEPRENGLIATNPAVVARKFGVLLRACDRDGEEGADDWAPSVGDQVCVGVSLPGGVPRVGDMAHAHMQEG